MTIFDAITNAVDSELLLVMAVSFVAVVWWGFRGRKNGGDGGSDGGAWTIGDGGDDDGGDGGDGGD